MLLIASLGFNFLFACLLVAWFLPGTKPQAKPLTVLERVNEALVLGFTMHQVVDWAMTQTGELSPGYMAGQLNGNRYAPKLLKGRNIAGDMLLAGYEPGGDSG